MFSGKRVLLFVLKILLTVAILFISYLIAVLLLLICTVYDIWPALMYICMLLFPCLTIPFLFVKNRKRLLMTWGGCFLIVAICVGINLGINAYDDSITINTAPNIVLEEYLPFDPSSKIVKLDKPATLSLQDPLPIVDGAAAVFPVYSAFVNAVYPNTTRLFDGVFEYNNTSYGYQLLAERKTDLFFGGYPSEEQISYALSQGTTFQYIPIAQEAFVFFVHKNNPIDELTSEDVRRIYSGEITNWSQLGGDNVPITAYQRNEGSGSQSQLIRFMGEVPIMTPPTEQINDLMIGILDQVADYRSKPGSIGFSFRYYVEGIIQNPDIKLLKIDGVAPTQENITSGAYPLVGALYAVTYEENTNPNVPVLLDWILSDEGQQIITETGYCGVS